MIRAKVLSSGEAIVSVKVRGPNGQIANVEASVDTEFNDQLTLPAWVVERLGLEFRDEGNYTLADGVTSVTRLFRADIEWLGEWRRILVVEIESDALLGMGMLQGCNLSVDVVDGGKVEIRHLGEGVRT